MPLRLAGRVSGIAPFLAMEVLERAIALDGEGAHVVHLEIGEPDLPPPPEAVDACARALAAGETRYTDSRGLLALREAIVEDAAQRTGARIDPGRVLVTNGTSAAMLLVFSLLVSPGDEVIVPTPHYPCYPNFVRVCGGTPVFVAARAAQGWRVDPGDVRAAMTPRTRAIVLGSPANPTGAVQERATLDALAGLGVPLVSDEIYGGIVYGGAPAASALALARDDVFVLDGVSKRYAMTGFRLGWVVAPADAARPLQVLQQNLFISANRFVQHAGIAALRHGEKTTEAMRSAYASRRERLVRGLRALGFGVPALPAGAFYVFADARAFGADSRRLAFDLLERAHVAVTPGIDFGEAGEGFLRFSYAVSERDLALALERMERVLRAG